MRTSVALVFLAIAAVLTMGTPVTCEAKDSKAKVKKDVSALREVISHIVDREREREMVKLPVKLPEKAEEVKAKPGFMSQVEANVKREAAQEARDQIEEEEGVNIFLDQKTLGKIEERTQQIIRQKLNEEAEKIAEENARKNELALEEFRRAEREFVPSSEVPLTFEEEAEIGKQRAFESFERDQRLEVQRNLLDQLN